MPEAEGTREVPTVWVGAEELPVQYVNNFVGITDPTGIYLTLGSLVPPPIVGDTVEERKAQAEAITFVPVKPVARVAMSPAGLKRLIEILTQTLQNYEAQQEDPRTGKADE